jgi:hypothetical protein
MEKITFEVPNPSDIPLLVALARRIGAVAIHDSTIVSEKSRLVLDAGCDVSSFGNPKEWQRESRKERTLIRK